MKRILLVPALLATTAFAAPAHAQSVAALVGDTTIAVVDASALKIDRVVEVTGLSGTLLGIDVRPSNGMLYGVVSDGSVVTIDLASGGSTKTAMLATMLTAGITPTVDFNPAADRLRIMGSDGTSLRANVDTGEVATDGSHAYVSGDANAGMKPNVVAGAYTNSVAGPSSTQLFNIDATSGALLLQNPPNDGVLNTVGAVAIEAATFAFDIYSSAEGENTAYLMADDTLYTIDLASGMATKIGMIPGADMPVRDIAVLPAM